MGSPLKLSVIFIVALCVTYFSIPTLDAYAQCKTIRRATVPNINLRGFDATCAKKVFLPQLVTYKESIQ